MNDELIEALDLAVGLVKRLPSKDQEQFREEIKQLIKLNDRLKYGENA